MNMISTQCQFQTHQQRQINIICLNRDCKSKRLCCLQCIGEFHRAHPEQLIEIDTFNRFIQQESKKQAEYPYSYTFGQCQLIQNLEELLVRTDSFKKLIQEQIQKLKNSSLQEYLKQQGNDQQGVQTWNLQIENILQYFELQNYVLTNSGYMQGELNETEQKSMTIINQAKDGLKLIEQSFHNGVHQKQLKFAPNPQKLESHQNDVYGVVISSDGSLIVSGSYDQTVKLWNVKAKELIKTFQYSGIVYGGVALSSNNQYLAFGGGGDYTIQLHDLKQNSNYTTLIGHSYTTQTIVFSQDSKLLYSGGNDNKLIIWDVSQKTQIHSFDTDSWIRTIVISPDNFLISCICFESINIWDYSTKDKIIYYKNPHYPRGLGLSSSKDSSIFISSGEDGLIKFWMLSDSENNSKCLKLTREIQAADRPIWKVILTSDEQYVVSICNQLTKIMIHEINSGNLIQELQFGNGMPQYVNGYISISNDMNVLVCGGEDKMVKIWTRE